VLIGSADLLEALKERASQFPGEMLAFVDLDAIKALDAITKRRPALVVLERGFAGTPRGMALVNRVKADATLVTEIRALSADSDFVRILSKKPAAPVLAVAALDQRGTRRAPRFTMTPNLEAMVDGSKAIVVDLSTVGAQVNSPGTLRPAQRARITLSDEAGLLRLVGTVVWVSLQMLPGSNRYIAGLEFVDADAAAVDAFIGRHRI